MSDWQWTLQYLVQTLKVPAHTGESTGGQNVTWRCATGLLALGCSCACHASQLHMAAKLQRLPERDNGQPLHMRYFGLSARAVNFNQCHLSACNCRLFMDTAQQMNCRHCQADMGVQTLRCQKTCRDDLLPKQHVTPDMLERHAPLSRPTCLRLVLHAVLSRPTC